MKWHFCSMIAIAALAGAARAEDLPPPRELPVPAVTVSAPVTHANLSIFLLHGKDTIASKRKILTTQEALDQKKLVVHETSNVNQLSVENVSEDVDVFIQSCDIVKGGRQDRVMAVDMLLSPKSGKTPIASFCCEHGRWQQRGAENAARFESSMAITGNNSLKGAVNGVGKSGQQEVWQEVDKAQKKLTANTGTAVTRNASPTSYQLALESKAVREKVDEYVKALTKALGEARDVGGVAIAVNGNLRSIDLYGSSALMSKLWDKLLQGAAIDALSELEKDKKFTPAAAQDVEHFLARAETGKWSSIKQQGGPARTDEPVANQSTPNRLRSEPARKEESEPRAAILRCDSDKILLVETQDTLSRNQMVHRCYLAK
jgi:hypothetical protein